MNENDMTQEDIMYAMTTLVMLPANNYKIHIGETTYSIKVPCRGTYMDLDPEFFSDLDGEFVIYADNTLNISTITKVLFGLKSYPDLADNQLFCPISFIIEQDTINVTGKIVTMLGD